MRDASEAGAESGRFEFQNWPVYREAIEFTRWAYLLCREMKDPELKELRDQLRRASQSIVLNLAEGTSRQTAADKVNFWRVSKGSVFECVAVLDILRGIQAEPDYEERFKQLETIGRMLSGLIRWVRENPRK